MNIQIEDFETILDEVAAAMPTEILRGLNGGIVLSPDIKVHPESRAKELLILGQYHVDPNGLGRYITIYYGSFIELYGHLPPAGIRKEIKRILSHELLHHLESLAGECGLEIQDAQDLARYTHERNKIPFMSISSLHTPPQR